MTYPERQNTDLPKVTVVIPVRNEERYIDLFLNAVLKQDYPADKMEIVVVEGASEDRTRQILDEYAKRHDNMRVIDNPGKIVPKALNIGIKSAKGDIIMRMDAHASYPVDYVRKCAEYLDRTGADNVGGVCEHVGQGGLGEAIALALDCKFGLGGAKFRTATKEQYVDTVFPGVWPRKTFEQCGYFNEKLARNQDIEYNARLRKKGGKILLNPEIRCFYYCRSNLKDLWKQNFRIGFWNIITVRITPGSLSLRHFIPLIFVSSLLTSWLVPPLWLFIVSSYILCNIFFSSKVAFKNGFRYLPVLPVIFLTLHISYGLGSLAGILGLWPGKKS
ncbi:glycosyltransferase family 2 protein [Candidatus Omnitrophota bacterium]